VAACCPVGYSPRHTVHSDLCRIVREHLPGFVELTERDGTTLLVQRFRSDAGLFVHLHLLATDGAFEEQPDGNIVFHPLTDLNERDLLRVLDAVAADLADASVPDDIDIDSSLASCVQLSLSTPTAPPLSSTRQHLVVFAHGMNLHAATTVDGRDRKRLERV
jgi:hypothetical protein